MPPIWSGPPFAFPQIPAPRLQAPAGLSCQGILCSPLPCASLSRLCSPSNMALLLGDLYTPALNASAALCLYPRDASLRAPFGPAPPHRVCADVLLTVHRIPAQRPSHPDRAPIRPIPAHWVRRSAAFAGPAIPLGSCRLCSRRFQPCGRPIKTIAAVSLRPGSPPVCRLRTGLDSLRGSPRARWGFAFSALYSHDKTDVPRPRLPPGPGASPKTPQSRFLLPKATGEAYAWPLKWPPLPLQSPVHAGPGAPPP